MIAALKIRVIKLIAHKKTFSQWTDNGGFIILEKIHVACPYPFGIKQVLIIPS